MGYLLSGEVDAQTYFNIAARVQLPAVEYARGLLVDANAKDQALVDLLASDEKLSVRAKQVGAVETEHIFCEPENLNEFKDDRISDEYFDLQIEQGRTHINTLERSGPTGASLLCKPSSFLYKDSIRIDHRGQDDRDWKYEMTLARNDVENFHVYSYRRDQITFSNVNFVDFIFKSDAGKLEIKADTLPSRYNVSVGVGTIDLPGFGNVPYVLSGNKEFWYTDDESNYIKINEDLTFINPRKILACHFDKVFWVEDKAGIWKFDQEAEKKWVLVNTQDNSLMRCIKNRP